MGNGGRITSIGTSFPAQWIADVCLKLLHLVNGGGGGHAVLRSRRRATLRRRRGTAALAVSALFGIWQIGLFGGKGKFVSSVSLAGKNMPVRTLEFIGKVQLESLQFQNYNTTSTLYMIKEAVFVLCS